MATESVKFLINAKDNTATAIGSAQRGFNGLKQQQRQIADAAKRAEQAMKKQLDDAAKRAEKLRRKMGAIKTAVLAAGFFFLAKSVRATIGAFVEMEKVQVSLAASLELNGANAEKAVPSFNKWANGLQATLNVSDEVANSLAISAQQMGVSVDASQEAATAAIGLSAALPGLSQEAALKGVANALEGNFSTLERYLPSLKATNDQNEKMAILLDASNKGIKIQAASTETLGGSWDAFKNTIVDTMENIGTVVGPTLTNMVKGFQFVLKNWTQISQLIGLTVTLGFVRIGNDLKHQLTVVWPTWIEWFGQTFMTVVDNVFKSSDKLISNFVNSIAMSFSALAEFVTSGFNLDKLQATLAGIVAKNAVDIRDIVSDGMTDLPEIADREMGAFERTLMEDAKRIKDNLQTNWLETFKVKIPPDVGDKLKKEFEENVGDKLNLKTDIGVNQAVESRVLTGNQGLSAQEKAAAAAEKSADKAAESVEMLSAIKGGIQTLIDKTKPSLIVEAP